MLNCQKDIYASYKLNVKTLCRQSKGCKCIKVFAILLLEFQTSNLQTQTSRSQAMFEGQNMLPTQTKKFIEC